MLVVAHGKDPGVPIAGGVVTDPILTAVALTLATKAAEGVAEGGKAAFEALVRLVRRKFAGRASAEAALANVQANPSDGARVEELRQVLAEAATDDPVFDADLRTYWRELSPHLNTGDGSVANRALGTIHGNVVQARDVHGGISFGGSDRGES